MELTASEELIAIENRQILKANGFDIEVNEDAPVTQKIKLISHPVSKNTVFDIKGMLTLIVSISINALLNTSVNRSRGVAVFVIRWVRRNGLREQGQGYVCVEGLPQVCDGW